MKKYFWLCLLLFSGIFLLIMRGVKKKETLYE